MEFLHLHSAEPADLAQVIPPQVHQHVVLSELFFVLQELLLQLHVFLIRLSSRPCPRQRECMEHAVLQPDQCLRGSACHLHICP